MCSVHPQLSLFCRVSMNIAASPAITFVPFDALQAESRREHAARVTGDKTSKGDWKKPRGEWPSLFVNAAPGGLLITGKLVCSNSEKGLGSALTRLIAKGGEPLIRKGVDLAMRMLGNQFV